MSRFEKYRGRLAPSPTGYLHLGHAKTFWTAQQRAKQNGGELIFGTRIWTAPAASRNLFRPCSKICAGSASNGAKARTLAAGLRHIIKASGRIFIAKR
ncbi:MAG TPA: glutamate--tRNA ligase family protein [Verrucomicrobiae bacterium]|nr:glutamate--tRNA ligase family protein [Verrucomicrobiae bacterium]